MVIVKGVREGNEGREFTHFNLLFFQWYKDLSLDLTEYHQRAINCLHFDIYLDFILFISRKSLMCYNCEVL